MKFQYLIKLFSTDIAIDLGTANCLVYVRDLNTLVLNEPSVVVCNANTHEVLHVGTKAKEMLGKTHRNQEVIRPMRDGVIANVDVTEAMLRTFIQKSLQHVPWFRRILSPRVVIAVPSGITEVESRAVKDSSKRAGAGQVVLVDEPMAAAIGVGLPVRDSCGNMVVDIGGGTTEVAVISNGDIVYADSVRVGGDELDEAITRYMREKYKLLIGPLTAERIKITIGSAYPILEEEQMEVRGLDMNGRVPKTVTVTGNQIREALKEPVKSILEKVHSVLEHCKPELAADLVERGIMLAGGGANLAGLDKMLSAETGLPVFVAEDPLDAVAKGAGLMMSDDELWYYNEN